MVHTCYCAQLCFQWQIHHAKKLEGDSELLQIVSISVRHLYTLFECKQQKIQLAQDKYFDSW
jgi:hypothetical protein